MTVDSAAIDSVPLAPLEVAGIWARHLTSLVIPISTLAFVLTGPHLWYIAPLFMLPMILALGWDDNKTVERRQPLATTPAWPFDGLVYFLTALHFLILFELVQMYSHQAFFSLDTIFVVIVVGGNSGFSIITAHELIHRRSPRQQFLGRLILASVLQEHFFTEHLRGHHVKVGLDEDPATARFGETYSDFYKRTVPAQFKSAWRIEAGRLGDPDMSLFDPRMLHNRIMQGLFVGWGMAFSILAAFGVVSFLIFLLQAFMASRLLEAVNYFEHWGLQRRTRRVQPVDSWDTHSWFTYYGLIGLSRHADHHHEPARPYQQLRVFEEAPILPTGYLGTIDMVMSGRNQDFMLLATKELQRRQLGPFHPDADPEEAAAACVRAEEIISQGLFKEPRFFGPNDAGESGWKAAAPALMKLLAFLLVVTIGVQFESATSMPFAARFLLNAWILVAFIIMIRCFQSLNTRWQNVGLSWTAALGVLVLLGSITHAIVGPIS